MDDVSGGYVCELCGVPLPDYKPERCCSGEDCCCRGLPIWPPWCYACWDKTIPEVVLNHNVKLTGPTW